MKDNWTFHRLKVKARRHRCVVPGREIFTIKLFEFKTARFNKQNNKRYKYEIVQKKKIYLGNRVHRVWNWKIVIWNTSVWLIDPFRRIKEHINRINKGHKRRSNFARYILEQNRNYKENNFINLSFDFNNLCKTNILEKFHILLVVIPC